MPPRAGASPRSSCAPRRGRARAPPASVSITVTGMPALAKFMAMPPPMVPAPMTATRFDRARRRVGGHVGDLGASRSAKKAWRCACDWVAGHQLEEELALALQPLVEGQVDGGLDGVDAGAAAASSPRARFADGARGIRRRARHRAASASLSSRSRMRRPAAPRSGRFSGKFARAPRTQRRHRRFRRSGRSPCASPAPIGSPVVIMSSAGSAPSDARQALRAAGAGQDARASPRAGRACAAASATR